MVSVRSPKCCIWFAQTSHLRLGISGGAIGISDRRSHGFGGLAGSAIISAQIKTNHVGFDAGQKQRSAAPRTGRPEVVDESEIERIGQGADSQRFLRPK